MPVTDQEHLAALISVEIRRQDDLRNEQNRAVELLAHANTARVSTTILIASLLVAIVSVGVAVMTLVLRR